jgi:hypothetical protein
LDQTQFHQDYPNRLVEKLYLFHLDGLLLQNLDQRRYLASLMHHHHLIPQIHQIQ